MTVKVSKGKTISEVVKGGLCTGCGTCMGTCPVDAIEMVIEHKKGPMLPVWIRRDALNAAGASYYPPLCHMALQ